MVPGLLSLALAQLLGGGALQIFLKIALTEFPPILLSFVRFVIATILLFLFLFWQTDRHLFGKDNFVLLRRSVLFAGNIAFFAIGIQFTTVIMGQIIYSLVPLIVMVLAHFVLAEKITRAKIVGFIIAFSGLAFLVMQSVVTSEHLTFGTPLGNGLVFLATLCWSMYIVYSKKISHTFTSSRITFANFIFTAIALVVFVPIEYQIRPLQMQDVTMWGIMNLLFLAIGTVIQYVAMQYGIKKTTATTASLFQYMGPFFAASFAVPFLHEKPTVALLVGGILILFGVFYATTFARIKKRFAPVLQ